VLQSGGKAAGDLRSAGCGAAFPAAYERVLRIWAEADPDAAGRARASLALFLADLSRSKDTDAFGRSTLTMTGSPFEPAFAALTPGLRYTVEPAPPEIAPAERLDYVLALLSRLDVAAPDAHVLRRIAPLQAMGSLRYGAQVGVRHDRSGDRYKLYIELPAQAQAQADAFGQALLGTPPVLDVPGRDARPALVGIELGSGKVEIYYRIENLHPLEIGTLLARANLAARAPEVVSLLAESQRTPIRHELPGPTWGFSYSLDADGEVTASIYTFARTLFGPDGWARDAVLSMARRHQWDLRGYAAMSEPLAGSRGFESHHGIFGVVVRRGSPIAAWVGLAPPPTWDGP
jgi:hypothetical protein